MHLKLVRATRKRGCSFVPSFKVVHRRVLEAIELKSQGSFIDAELVIKAIRSGFKVFQMGVDYFPRTRCSVSG